MAIGDLVEDPPRSPRGGSTHIAVVTGGRGREQRPMTGVDAEIGSFPSSLTSHAPRLKTEEIDRATKAQFDNQS